MDRTSSLHSLGEGGVSEVFKAWETTRGRIVVLKVLRSNLAAEADALRQFQRELETLPRLSHPNIIKTFDANRCGNRNYFAMEHVEGIDLAKYARQTGPLPLDQACDFVRQVAQGLQHAYQMGMVHRDIKPANLFLINPPNSTPGPAPLKRPADPIVKILDWGLARMAALSADDSATRAEIEYEKGALIGTADYIAPEQAQDASLVDIRGDIYSLGCTSPISCWRASRCSSGTSLMQKLLQHRELPIPRVLDKRPEVPEEISEMIQKMMAKAPEERFQIPLLVVAPLRRYCTGASGMSGSMVRPSLVGVNTSLIRPASSANLTRPPSSSNLTRPASALNLTRPSSSPNLPRP